MAFIDTRFPPEIGGFAKGGGEFLTKITTSENGDEQRVLVWDEEKSSFTISGTLRTRGPGYLSFEVLNNLHKDCRGRGHSFRFRDIKDYAATKNSGCLGKGAGTGYPTMQLTKRYFVPGGIPYFRTITKPVPGTFKCFINNVESPSYTIDYLTGVVSCPALKNIAISSVSLGSNPTVTTSQAHGFTNGQTVYFAFIPGASNLYNKAFQISNVTDTTFQLQGVLSNVAVNSGNAQLYVQPNQFAQCSFESDLAVRFDDDKLNAGLGEGGFIEVDSISLVEVKE